MTLLPPNGGLFNASCCRLELRLTSVIAFVSPVYSLTSLILIFVCYFLHLTNSYFCFSSSPPTLTLLFLTYFILRLFLSLHSFSPIPFPFSPLLLLSLLSYLYFLLPLLLCSIHFHTPHGNTFPCILIHPLPFLSLLSYEYFFLLLLLLLCVFRSHTPHTNTFPCILSLVSLYLAHSLPSVPSHLTVMGR